MRRPGRSSVECCSRLAYLATTSAMVLPRYPGPSSSLHTTAKPGVVGGKGRKSAVVAAVAGLGVSERAVADVAGIMVPLRDVRTGELGVEALHAGEAWSSGIFSLAAAASRRAR